ncbi:ABC transporter permease [Anaerocolumna sp. AGMB13025]|uniref:ABC transporter permease n=1 Tax=Anaerocolumna sp. AGMB13025 TaxID=3039116 RepID=UPI00241C207E|nr:ABC transporter permease [Anaerocolumna sp. AGMB13025]WFR58114.1 ABC transporter permease [Anaerocolumna sp. AGMB13025]
MKKLIKLELRRNNLRTYLVSSAVSCLVLLVLIYFIAYAAQLEDSSAREIVFRSYTNIFRLTGIISLVVFATMSAIMYSRLIIGEYTGKRAALLFSYPVSRSKILFAKLLLVFVFTSVSMLICTAIPYLVFSITESVSPIVVQDVMTVRLVADALKTSSVAVIALGGIGIVSLRIGFIQKSVPATLISAILLSTIYGNAAINASSILSSMLISGIGLVVAVAVMIELSNKVNKMEVA